jgi:hypothetical protein
MGRAGVTWNTYVSFRVRENFLPAVIDSKTALASASDGSAWRARKGTRQPSGRK